MAHIFCRGLHTKYGGESPPSRISRSRFIMGPNKRPADVLKNSKKPKKGPHLIEWIALMETRNDGNKLHFPYARVYGSFKQMRRLPAGRNSRKTFWAVVSFLSTANVKRRPLFFLSAKHHLFCYTNVGDDAFVVIFVIQILPRMSSTAVKSRQAALE